MGSGSTITSNNSEAGTAGSASPESPSTRPPSEPSDDLQSLLSGTLRHLSDTTHSSRACAWAFRPDGETFVVAATYRDAGEPLPPDAGSLAALEEIWRENRPLDLGARGPDSPLALLGKTHGFSCCAPIISQDGERLVMLFLGGGDDSRGEVRPRTLAALEGAIQRLRGPAMAESARLRLNQLGDEISRLDRLASLGDLLAVVAHEIRNPLVSVKTFLHLLPDYRDDDEFHGNFREVVIGELTRMERLLDNLLQHARPNRDVEPHPDEGGTCDIAVVLDSMLRLLSQRALEREISLRVELDDHLPELAISEDNLRQILLNLILNALEAAPASSAVTLRGQRSYAGALALEIEDHGEGIPESVRPRLFEAFFSTRANRAGGLGLAISKKLVNEAGGRIWVEDAVGGGALFRLELPAAS